MKPTPGTKVTIRSWEDMEAQYGLDKDGDIRDTECDGLAFVRRMRKFCGTTQEVAAYNDPAWPNEFEVKDGGIWRFHANHTEEFKALPEEASSEE